MTAWLVERLLKSPKKGRDSWGSTLHTGSIAVGKAADLVLVEGDPTQRIGDLRHTRVVMLDDKLLDAALLRAASGFSGRPQKECWYQFSVRNVAARRAERVDRSFADSR